MLSLLDLFIFNFCLKTKNPLAKIWFDRTRESESKLLQDAKRFTVELEKQRMELEKASFFSFFRRSCHTIAVCVK